MVFSRRRGSALRPVHSLKHIVDQATSAVTSAVSTVILIQSADSPTLGNTAQVMSGSTVNAIYLRVETLATSGFSGIPRVYMAVFKNPGNALGSPNPSSLGDADEKRYVIHQEMQMLAPLADSAFPRTLFQGVIKIPPRLKRFGYNDRLTLLLAHDVAETTGITNICAQCIYKEFR